MYTRKKYSWKQNVFHFHKSKTLFHKEEIPVYIFIFKVKLIHKTTVASVHYSTTLFNLQKLLEFVRN